MSPDKTGRLVPDAAAALITLVFAYACVRFAWQPGLASFADDSASYLIMAQVLSPWQAASAAVAEAFVREAFYPPLFPLLLGLAGAGQDVALAHILSALLIAAILPLSYLLAVCWLPSRWSAAAVVAVVAALPALWIQSKGILSEPLFCLLMIGTLLAAERRMLPALAIAMAGLILTRTVGIVVIAAYLAYAISRRGEPWTRRMHAAWPAFAALAVYGAWVLLRPAATTDDYARILGERGQAMLIDPHALGALGASLARQARSIGEGWLGCIMLFWVSGRVLPVAVAAGLGALALAGLGIRLAAGRADAWMVGAYVATFLVWPFYDQMTRFLFPALPILAIYVFHAVARILGVVKRPGLAAAIVAPAFLSLGAPALAFVHQRAVSPEPYVSIVDWYRTPDLARARLRSQVHLDLFSDMETIRRLTRRDDRVMWVTPSYLALLADRRGVAAPDASLPPAQYRAVVGQRRPDFVFMSFYHPRDTISDRAWQAGVAAMAGYAPVVHIHSRPDGSVSSMLLKLRDDDLVAHASGR